MELLTGLLFAGNMLNNKIETENTLKNTKKKILNKTGENIYNSRQTRQNQEQIHKIAENNYNLAKQYNKTGIIPNNLNRDNEKQNNKSEIINDINYETTENILEKQKAQTFNLTGGNASKINSQFTNMRFNQSSTPNAFNNHDPEFENFSNFNQHLNMTYGLNNDMTHINMMPYFKSPGYGQNQNVEDKIAENQIRKMNLFSGSANNVDYSPKQEKKPLFNPIVGLTHPNGMPNSTDYQSQYYIPSKYRNNELPFQPTKVTPGLALGYNQENKNGIGETYRTFYPNTNELRTLNNPKISYTGENSIMNNQNPVKRTSIPTIKQHKPNTWWEMDKPVNKQSESKKPIIRKNYVLNPTARSEISQSWAGPAKYNIEQTKTSGLMPRPEPSTKQNFDLNRSGGGAGQAQLLKNTAFDKNNNTPDLTLRNFTEVTNYISNIRNPDYKPQAFSQKDNIPLPTLKQLFELNSRIGAPIHHELQKAKYTNFIDIPEPTLKQFLIDNLRVGNINQGQLKTILFNYHNAIPDLNMRNIHDKSNRSGVALHDFTKIQSRNPNSSPNLTLRDLIVNNTQVGQIQNNVLHKPQYINTENAKPELTQRDIYNTYDRAGNITNTEKSYNINSNDIPKSTQRDIYNTYDRAGNITNTEKSYNINPNDLPKSTQRDIYNTYDRAGNITNTEKSYNINPNDIPKLTLRNIISQFDRAGASSKLQIPSKQPAFDSVNNIPDVTLRNLYSETIQAGHGIGHSALQKITLYDKNIPNTTLQELLIHPDRVSAGLGKSEFDKQPMFDSKSNIPDITRKDTTCDTKYIGQLGNPESNKFKMFDSNANQAPITNRQMSEKNTYIAPLKKSDKLHQMSRMDFNNAISNAIREVIAKGRTPTTSNYEKGPTIEHSQVELANPIQINRELYPDIIQDSRTRIPISINRQSQHLPQNYDKNSSFVHDNLKNNPFVNNIIHQSGVNV